MKMRTAILTGVTGLMLNMGLGSAVFAQPPAWRYRSMRYGMNNEWQAQQMVAQAYRDILRREPDPSGLQAYTDNVVRRGWSEADVRHALLTSPEYAQRFGGARFRGYRYNPYYR
jgi:hypothetical protein